MNIFKSNAVSDLMQGLIDKVVSPEASKEVQVRNYPKMVASSQEEIEQHNKSVKTRQVLRSEKRINDKYMKKS